MTLHPLTRICIALAWGTLAVSLPPVRSLAVIAVWIVLSLSVPSRTEARVAVPFIKMLVIAGVFLLLIHAVRWFPFGVSLDGIRESVVPFIRIAVPVTAIMYLSRRITSEEFYAFLIDIHMPPVIILILFRVLWLVPRLRDRMDEVTTAQKLRGMHIDTTRRRIMALLPTLSPIFSSMFEEISENAVTITTRGFLDPGQKTHFHDLPFCRKDVLMILAAILTMVVIVWL